MIELKACVSCGALVPEKQDYPYPNHKPDCALVLSWKSERRGRGLGIHGLKRTSIRKPLFGHYRGFGWRIEGHGPGLFRWDAGKLSGWTRRGATLRTAALDVREATKVQEGYVRRFGREAPKEVLEQLNLLFRWMRCACNSTLRIQLKKHRDTNNVYHQVEELS